MRRILASLLVFVALGAHAQEPAPQCSAALDQQPPQPRGPLASPTELCAHLPTAASGQPWACDVSKRLNARLHVWRASDALEGELYYLAARHRDGWHIDAPFFTTWTTPGGGLSVRFEDWQRQPMGAQELITLELRTKGIDPDHDEPPMEMEESSSITVLCVGDPKGGPRCVSFATRRHGAWWDLQRLPSGALERTAQQEPWHASARYTVKRSGWLELTKVAGEWKTLQSDFSWRTVNDAPIETCMALRVRLW